MVFLHRRQGRGGVSRNVEKEEDLSGRLQGHVHSPQGQVSQVAVEAVRLVDFFQDEAKSARGP